MLENTIGLAVVFSWARLVITLVGAGAGSDFFMRNDGIAVAKLNQTRKIIDSLTAWDKCVRFVTISLWSTWRAYSVHPYAIGLCFVRILDVASLFKSTQSLLLLFAVAFWPVVYFFMIFYVVLSAFAVVLYMKFGSLYVEFYTLYRAQWTLLLYNFQGRGLLNNHHQYEDKAAGRLEIILLVYDILVIIVFGNVFTTIVIEAYAISTDPDRLQSWFEDKNHRPIWQFWSYLRWVYERPDMLRRRTERHHGSDVELGRTVGTARGSGSGAAVDDGETARISMGNTYTAAILETL